MAGAGPVSRLVSTGAEIDDFFNGGNNYVDLSIAHPNAPDGFYDIEIVYREIDNKITIKRKGNPYGSNCVTLDIYPDNINLNSLLYTIHRDNDICKDIDGATYLNLVLALCKVYTRQVLNPDGSIKNKYITLTDAAKKSLGPRLDKVELSILLLLEKGRTYYEGYGFLPIFIINGDEDDILPFDSPEYLKILSEFLDYRNTFILDPIRDLRNTPKFNYELNNINYSLIESDNINANNYIADELSREFGRNNISISEIYTSSVSPGAKTDFLLQLGFDDLNIIGNLCSDYRYTYPILTRENRERIMQVYLDNGIDSIKPEYAFFILSDNLHGPSGNISKTKRLRHIPGAGYVRENVEPHLHPIIVELNQLLAGLPQDDLDQILGINPPVAAVAEAPIMLPTLPNNIQIPPKPQSLPSASSRSPRRLSRQNSKPTSGSGSGGRRRSRSRSPPRSRRANESGNSGSSGRRQTRKAGGNRSNAVMRS